jgi:hypothetical protein
MRQLKDGPSQPQLNDVLVQQKTFDTSKHVGEICG